MLGDARCDAACLPESQPLKVWLKVSLPTYYSYLQMCNSDNKHTWGARGGFLLIIVSLQNVSFQKETWKRLEYSFHFDAPRLTSDNRLLSSKSLRHLFGFPSQ